MTAAFNLSQLAKYLNSQGQLDASSGLFNEPASSASIVTTNFQVKEVGGKLCFYYGTTLLASLDASGNLTTIGNITAYGTP